MARVRIAGIEMGGTKCVLLLGSGPDDIQDRHVIATGAPAPTLAAIVDRLEAWDAQYGFDAIGIGSFGPLQLYPAHPDYGAIVATSKPGWSGTNVLRAVAGRFARPVALQTDVNAAALAEGRWGGARGLADHAYVTIGTGVGVGLIVGGRPAGGVAHGEMGHIRVGRATGDTWPGACPFHGDCVEGLISGPALAARHGRPGTEIPPAHRDWDLFEHTLTGLLHTLVLTLVPARIAIGGGVVAGRAEMFAALRRRLAHSLNGYGAMRDYCADLDQRIGPPGLGDLAGPLGPIALGLDALCA